MSRSKLIYANLITNVFHYHVIEHRGIQGGSKKQKCMLMTNFFNGRKPSMANDIISYMKKNSIKIAKIVWLKKKVRVIEIFEPDDFQYNTAKKLYGW